MVLGPSQSLELQLTEIWLRDIPDIVDGKTGFDFAVWLTYQDTFTEHKHQTQLVQRFAADKDGGTSFAYYGVHNCADDDCPAK